MPSPCSLPAQEVGPAAPALLLPPAADPARLPLARGESLAESSSVLMLGGAEGTLPACCSTRLMLAVGSDKTGGRGAPFSAATRHALAETWEGRGEGILLVLVGPLDAWC